MTINLPDYVTVPDASSLKLSDARREQLLATYLHVYAAFAADRSDVADDVFDGDKPKATRALNTLRDVGLLCNSDTNEESQGSQRRGSFKELVWQSWMTHDDIDEAQAREVFARVFPADPTNTNPIGATMTSTTSTRTINKTEEKELARHSALRDAFKDAFADVETSDAPMESAEATKLRQKRDAIHAQLHGVAEKLRKRGYTLEHDDSAPTPPTPKEDDTVTATTTTAPAKPEFSWPKPAAELVNEYLAARNAPEFDTDNELRPYVNGSGKVFIHSVDWREWLTAQGIEATKAQAALPLRELGLTVRATPIPTRDYAKGFYTGAAPAGAKDLAKREAKRGGGGTRGPRSPFGKLDDNQRAMLREALTAMPKNKLKGERGEIQTALLKFLDVADEASTDTDTDDAPKGDA